jgi:hypothetical protein
MNKLRSPYLLIGLIVAVGIYIFGTGGFNLNTITGFFGWVLSGLGILAFIGGARKSGAIVFVAGMVIVNLPSLLRLL